MNNRIEVCHCGHAKDTHFEKDGQCLGLGCNRVVGDFESTYTVDVCGFYRSADRKVRGCRCSRCMEAA
jgi:hypothetical protein